MIKALREQFNANFTQEKYQHFLNLIEEGFGEAPTFRVCETPIFIPKELRKKLFDACEHINDVITHPDFNEAAKSAIKLPDLLVPNEDHHPLFLQYDFGICEGEDGELIPQLIELQGFPSLYFFQHLLAGCYREAFDIPAHVNHLFNGLNNETYLDLLREVIVGDQHPENVILLEIEPEKQHTRIDFWGVYKLLGIKILCLSKLKREGKELYYFDHDGKRVTVKRIFNRVIFDELLRRKDLFREFNMTEEVDVEWAGHPNWFMKISKYTMPSLDSPFVPKTYFLNEIETYPEDLENYVLKPLFSFSGEGVKFHVKKEDLEAIDNPEDYILQHKAKYAYAIQTSNPNEPSKVEIRMMMIWKQGWDRPKLVNNLVRLTKGEMVGVKYNKDKDWVGASVAFFEQD
ncbi:MAG: hypothetical protein KDC24_00725 [Saprospiraceae bacterium]|nr:hypothetical protein [Saprospiraceae bacterium]